MRGGDLEFWQVVTSDLAAVLPWVAWILLSLLFLGAIFIVWLTRRVGTEALIAFTFLVLGLVAIGAMTHLTGMKFGYATLWALGTLVACFVAHRLDCKLSRRRQGRRASAMISQGRAIWLGPVRN